MHSSTSHSSTSDADRLLGQMLDSRLRVLRCIGRGGMGTVYVAEHIGLGKQVAVKVLNAPYTGQAEVVSRLHSEARNAAAIASEHIVDIFDIGLTDSGQPYVVMELLHGESLAERLRRCTALSELDTLHIGRQLATALAAAHRSGIVHRDIKPENIFLCHRDGRDFVKLLDFGISKAVGPLADTDSPPDAEGSPAGGADEPGPPGPVASSDASDRPGRSVAADTPSGKGLAWRERGQVSEELLHRLTRTGAILGTPLYMSPEQARGERLDSRCDIYSLGVVLYECLTGSVPFLSTSYFGVIAKILTETPEPPSVRIPDRALSPALEQIVLGAMAAERSERYRTMDALLADLDRYQRGEPVQAFALARTAGRAGGRADASAGGDGLLADGVAGRRGGRRDRGPLPLLLPLLAGTLVVLLLGGLLVFWRGPQSQQVSAAVAPPLARVTSGSTTAAAPDSPGQAPQARSAPAHPAAAEPRPAAAVAPPSPAASPIERPAPRLSSPAAVESPPSRPSARPQAPRLKPARPEPELPPPMPMPLRDEQAPNPFVQHAP